LDVSCEDVLASIGSALAHNSELKRLSFRENDMGEFAVGILSKALAIHASLQHLDLSDCRFASSTGLLSLVEGLGKNRSLATISLEACKLGEEGAAFIGQALHLNRTLQSIDLCENGIQLEGLTMLEQNKMLQSVYLQGNEICDEGALLLRSLLQEKNKTIREVDY
jgi:Ran GTPase-activating protein (RanGAP) involved in mRNA processing and transport